MQESPRKNNGQEQIGGDMCGGRCEHYSLHCTTKTHTQTQTLSLFPYTHTQHCTTQTHTQTQTLTLFPYSRNRKRFFSGESSSTLHFLKKFNRNSVSQVCMH